MKKNQSYIENRIEAAYTSSPSPIRADDDENDEKEKMEATTVPMEIATVVKTAEVEPTTVAKIVSRSNSSSSTSSYTSYRDLPASMPLLNESLTNRLTESLQQQPQDVTLTDRSKHDNSTSYSPPPLSTPTPTPRLQQAPRQSLTPPLTRANLINLSNDDEAMRGDYKEY